MMESKGKMMIKSVSQKVILDLRKQGKLTNGMRTVEIFKRKPPWLVTRVKELCAVTSLHGYSHTIQQDYAIWER
jgi:neutral trehalase